MSIGVRYYLQGFLRICLHFAGFTRKKRATRKKNQIAVAQVDLHWVFATPAVNTHCKQIPTSGLICFLSPKP
jgi:hypothetical protein